MGFRNPTLALPYKGCGGNSDREFRIIEEPTRSASRLRPATQVALADLHRLDRRWRSRFSIELGAQCPARRSAPSVIRASGGRSPLRAFEPRWCERQRSESQVGRRSTAPRRRSVRRQGNPRPPRSRSHAGWFGRESRRHRRLPNTNRTIDTLRERARSRRRGIVVRGRKPWST